MEESQSDGNPTMVSLNTFIAARVQEITALSLQIASSSGVGNKGLAFQHVPKHMRRRAVSHNVKRLPKRLQQSHLRQLNKSSGGPQKKPKRPSRKYRRRKSNLLHEYNRRQRFIKWMETHIWHAKRFHMDSKWNYKVPLYPNDKGYRAIYRAFRQYCAMRDVSFYSCIQITSPYHLLSEKFNLITCADVDVLSIGSDYYRKYHREGHAHIYHKETYPYGYIGEVRFIWISETTIWLWVHPSYKREVLDELVDIFNLSLNFKLSSQTTQSLGLDEAKLEPKNLGGPSEWSSIENDVIITDLHGSLNRFQLRGPQTFSVLKSLLQLKSIMSDSELTKSPIQKWFREFYDVNPDILNQQQFIWSGDESAFPNEIVLPLIVRDPRIFTPGRRHKFSFVHSEPMTMEAIEEFQDKLNAYLHHVPMPITNCKIRDQVLKEKLSDSDLSKRRAKLLIPGSEVDLGDEEDQIPILLINRSTFGWDLIVPAGWAMAFWIALSYRCVRAFGSRDSIHYAFEYETVHSSELLAIDTLSAQLECQILKSQRRETYFKLPPGKRENLVRLKCPFPFEAEWKVLLNYWNPHPTNMSVQSQHFYVLRNEMILKDLENLLKKCGTTQAVINIPESLLSCSLIGVGIKVLGKGKPGPLSLISIPDTEEDIRINCDNIEEPHENCSLVEIQKKQLRRQHQKQMALLRKKRKRIRKHKENEDSMRNILDDLEALNSSKLSELYNSAMDSLSIPMASSVLSNQSRRPFGILTLGDESYQRGRCYGFGYVTLSGLLNFINHVQHWKYRNIVLVRDASRSLTYARAQLQIHFLSS